MKGFYLVLLLLFVAAVGIFAFQNGDDVTIKYFNQNQALPLPALVGAVYLLGMLTGWTVVGLVKKSVQRVTERRDSR